ncbi:MAG TPA: EamA family transporter [Patescibacteria group bacterium]|nr:EamA family transporter [Patescibacteria group bacterium]
MGIIATILVVAGALALAFYNVLSRIFQRDDWRNRSALVSVATSVGSAIMLLGYSLVTGGPSMSAGWLFPVLATGILNIGIMFAKMRARALEDVSLVTPIDSTTPVVVIFTAMIIVGEFPTRLGWVGIWVLVLGTYVLNIQELRQQLAERDRAVGSRWWRELRVWLAPFLALRKSAGVRWAFFAVALSTISLNYDGLTARRTDVGFGFGLVYAIVALGNATVAVVRQEHRGATWEGFSLRMVILGLPLAVGTILTGLAFQLSLVAYVGTMKRVVIPLTIILAYFVLKERGFFRQRIVGGIIMAVGAALVALGG